MNALRHFLSISSGTFAALFLSALYFPDWMTRLDGYLLAWILAFPYLYLLLMPWVRPVKGSGPKWLYKKIRIPFRFAIPIYNRTLVDVVRDWMRGRGSVENRDVLP